MGVFLSRKDGSRFFRLVSCTILKSVDCSIAPQTPHCGVELSASEVARHAIEKHLASAHYPIEIMPWPEKPDPVATIRRLEEEIRRLRLAAVSAEE